MKTPLLLIALLWTSFAGAIPRYGVTALEQLPLDRRYFVQGLEFSDGQLFLSSGGYGDSELVVFDFPSMAVNRSTRLPDRYFAEGLTRIDDILLVLTWRSGDLLLLNPQSLEQRGTGTLPGEGWGITHNGNTVWFSDGSATLHRFDLTSGRRLESVPVTLQGRPVHRLNELEWVDDEIWANVWMTDQIVRIDPESGAVTGIIDLQGLLPADARKPDTDVLNGIARDPKTGDIWVTGKRWPWLYRIELTTTP